MTLSTHFGTVNFQGIIKCRWKCILSGHHAVFPQNFDICLNLTESLHAMVVSFSQ